MIRRKQYNFDYKLISLNTLVCMINFNVVEHVVEHVVELQNKADKI